MRSPFAIFRKHAQVLTVVLTGLAMFAFVVMDQIRSNPQLFPIILSALLLGTAFWILGRPTGKSTEYGVGGMLLGVILMVYVVPLVSRPTAAVNLTIGSLSAKELQDSVRRMQEANRFVSAAMQEAKQPSSRAMFGFGRDPGEDAVMAFILNHEAEMMGIHLSDDAVNEFITTITDNKLSQPKFKKIRTGMRLGESELYNIIREQLQAQVAMQMLMPRNFTTPSNYWDYYRRLNVKQEIKVAAVPVSAFVSEAKLLDAEILAFFEQYKNYFPGRFVSPEPAFGQPRKVRLAYLEVDYKEARKTVEKVSDQDVRDFYEENKDERFQNLPSIDNSETPPFENSTSPPDEDKPLEPVIAPEPGPELKDKQPDKTSPDKASPDKKEADENKSDGTPKTPSQENNKAEDNKAQFSVQDDSLADDAATDPASSTGQPVQTDPDNAPVEAPVPGDVPEVPEGPVAASDPPWLPLDDELINDIREELLHARTVAAVSNIRADADKFMRNIDDDYNLNAPRTDTDEKPYTPEEQAEIAKRASDIVTSVKQFAKKNGLNYVELELHSDEELTERGQAAADLWNKIEGADADASEEDHKTLKYLIFQATEISRSDESSNADRLTVRQVVFGSQQDRLYSPEASQDDLSNNQYVYWKTDDKKAHVPKFEEPGIREQVVEALKQFRARKPARKRALELAALVPKATEGGKSMEDALDGQRLLKDETDSLELSVLDNGESFSWLTISTAQSPNPFVKPPPTLSTLTAVEHAGNEFMSIVFHELGIGDVAVAPNADRSVFYIVQVKNRTPSKQGGLLALKDQFMREKFFGEQSQFFGTLPSSYTYLTTQTRRESFTRWSNQLLKKYSTAEPAGPAP